MPFIYNGEKYTDAQVEEAARISNLSVDDYIAKAGLEFTADLGKTQPQVPGAPAEETKAPDTESKSGIGLWESLGARTLRGFSSTARGAVEVSGAATMLLLGLGKNLMGEQLTDEEKQGINTMIKFGSFPGQAGSQAFKTTEAKLSKSVRNLDYEGPTDALTKGDWAAAAELTVGGALESLPSTLLAFTPGGIAVMGATAAGNKFSEEFEENPKESLFKLGANAAATGIIEAQFERATRGLGKQLGLINPTSAKEAVKTLSSTIGKNFINAIGLGALKEGASEAATEATLIINDALTLGKYDDMSTNLKRVGDAFLIGGFTGGSLGTVSSVGGKNTAARQRAEQILMPIQMKVQQKKLADEINSLTDALNQEETEEGKTAITEKIKLLEGEAAKIKKENSIALSFLNNETLKQYAKNASEIDKASKIINSDKSTSVAKELATEKINNLDAENLNILKTAQETKFREIVDKSRAEAEASGIEFGVYNTESYNKRVQEIRAENPNIKIEENANGTIVQLPDGSQEILINEEVALDKGAVNVAAHELLHGVLFKTVKDNPEAAKNLGNALLETIVKMDIKQVADSKFRRILQAYQESGATEEVQAEEILTNLSDAIVTGDLQFNENIFTKIGDVIRRTLQAAGLKQIKFDTGKDVYNFIKDYNRSVKRGKFNKAMREVTAKGAKGKLIPENAQTRAEAEAASKESLSADAKKDMMDTYNRLMEGVERTDYSKNNPLPRRLENELVPKFYGYVNTLVNKKFRQVEEEAIEKEDAVAILMAEVANALRTFNPAKNDDISGYVASIIARRQSMIFADVKEEFTDDVETSKEAQAFVEEEPTPADLQENIKEIEKKVSLAEGLDTTIEVEGKSFEQHVKDVLTKSVARSVRKINEDTSANRTVTPFVESIKSDLAEELRKVSKQYINTYGYEKFLTDYRELILSNFTTTYLSKHPLFRKGIEKSIGGKMSTDNQGNAVFEPNWVLPTETSKGKFEWVDANGKKAKIDRDNAGVRGLTSGPEIIRRSKKIAQIVTEEEFVNYHFQDGPLRKKKKQNPEDALAMQIASEIGFDYLKQDFLNEKELFKKAQEYGEAMGIAVLDTHAQELAKQMDRGVVKYSISLDTNDFAWVINEASKDSSIENLIDKTNKKYKATDPKRASMLSLINEGVLGLATRLKKFGEESNLGLAYEKSLGKMLNSAGVADVEIVQEGNFDNQRIDIKISQKGNALNGTAIEVKSLSNDQMASFTIQNISETEFESTLAEGFLPEGIINKIQEALKDYKTDLVEKYNNALRKAAKDLEQETGVKYELKEPGIPGVNNTLFLKGHRDVFDRVNSGGYGITQKDLNVSIPLTVEDGVIEKLYERKSGDYIQIGDKGLFYLGSGIKENYLGAPTLSEAVENIRLEVRVQRKNQANTFLPLNASPRITKMAESTISLDDLSTVKDTIVAIAKSSISTEDKSRLNDMISETANLTKAEISEATATRVAKNKGKFRFYIPPSADDFTGLMYYMLRKGDLGEKDMAFIKEKLLDPFAKNHAAWESYKHRKLNEFRQFKKLIRKSPTAKLTAKNNAGFTNEDAVRVWLWDKKGTDLGDTITAAEKANLIEIVESNPDLLQFAQSMANLFGGAKNYPDPSGNWFNGSMTIDVIENINEFGRKTFFQTFNDNVEELFGKLDNKGEISGPIANKLRAAYGNNYVEALSDIIYRMKNGRSREFGKNRLMNQLNNWISNSVGAVMFFNTRSALLQQVSMVNFINLSDNNPIKFAQAIANPKQYWSDYLFLLNSDFLVSRRDGIKIDVNQDEIAKAAESGKNPVQSVISLILKKGFALTTWGDSHAIATGGAAFYRNRINTYLKDGLSQKEAEEKAFFEFKELAEESQQSSRPDRISQQQASTAGRIILAWANTPMQYARLTKKATLDLINGRGDWKTNMSKIIYYGAVQNLMFTYMQQGLFSMIFDGEDNEEEDAKKWEFTFNSMADGFLRGLGFGGAIASTAKNMVIEAIDQSKGRGNYDEVVWEALKLSPPLGSKIAKARAVGRTFGWKQEREKVFTEGWSLDNPAFEAVGKAVSATTNIPLDRVIRKLDNISYPVRHEVEFWQAVALYAGWGQWELGLKDVKKREKQKNKPKNVRNSAIQYK